MCDAVDFSDTQAVQDDILGTIPGVVTNYAAYFKQNFRDSSEWYPKHRSRTISKSLCPIQSPISQEKDR